MKVLVVEDSERLREALRTGLERFRKASLRARKMRMMGSAALGMANVRCFCE